MDTAEKMAERTHHLPQHAFSHVISVNEPAEACELLARATTLSKTKIKDCMLKGGVWRQKNKQAATRLRRATAMVTPGERLEIHYDPHLLALTPPTPELVFQGRRYSVWNKPAGVLAQGTRFADHCTLPRLAQNQLGLRTEPHPVHRLDREARGLMLLAHDPAAAAPLSELFRSGQVEKEYLAIVAGLPEWTATEVNLPLDGRESRSVFRLLQVDQNSGTALVSAHIDTGRKHQIRRHLLSLGHPVLGDPRYGKNNACPLGLQLLAQNLAFTCPFSGQAMRWSLAPLTFPLPLEHCVRHPD